MASHPCCCQSRKRLLKATLHVTVMFQGRLLRRSYPALPEPFTAAGKGTQHLGQQLVFHVPPTCARACATSSVSPEPLRWVWLLTSEFRTTSQHGTGLLQAWSLPLRDRPLDVKFVKPPNEVPLRAVRN